MTMLRHLNGSCCCAARLWDPIGDCETPVSWSPDGSSCLVICEHLYNHSLQHVQALSVNNIPLEETSAFNLPLLSNFRYCSPRWCDVDSSCVADLAFCPEHRLRPFDPASRLLSIHGFARGHHVACERAERHAETHYMFVDLSDRQPPPCLAGMEKVKAAIPGTAEHKFKKEEKAVQKDETKAMDAGNKMQMNEKNKLESHVPGTTDHKLTHQ